MAEFVTGNRFLSQSEMEINATYAHNYLIPRGWTVNAIAGMLGNWETESTVNPGIWQDLREGGDAEGHGFGLVQWTPYTKYTNWCEARSLDPSHMDSALQRIEWELENGEQYYATDAYPLSFSEFKVSTASPYYLGMAFLANYERPAEPNQPARGTQAQAWYEFLTGLPAPDPGTPSGKVNKHKMSLLLMAAALRK